MLFFRQWKPDQMSNDTDTFQIFNLLSQKEEDSGGQHWLTSWSLWYVLTLSRGCTSCTAWVSLSRISCDSVTLPLTVNNIPVNTEIARLWYLDWFLPACNIPTALHFTFYLRKNYVEPSRNSITIYFVENFNMNFLNL